MIKVPDIQKWWFSSSGGPAG